MYIGNIRVTYKNAPQEVLDCMTMKETDLHRFYEDLLAHEGIDEAVVLQTCNRFEVYIAGRGLDDYEKINKFITDNFGESVVEYVVMDRYVDTLKHLFNVVSSVDSMIVGENQIMSQVKDALAYASQNRFSGKILEPLFQKALSVGKKVRTSTEISRGKVSVSSAAVDLANKHQPIKDKKIVVVGTGKMASLLGEYLQEFGFKEMVVIGRTPDRVNNFCKDYNGRVSSFDNLSDELMDSHILFSATACPTALIPKSLIENVMSDKTDQLLLVDIAMPADIEHSVREIPNVKYFCIDDLREISEQNLKARQEEVKQAEQIIEDEISVIKSKLKNLHMDFYLSNLMKYMDEIRQRELEKAVLMLNDGEKNSKVEEVLDGFSKSMMKKVMHNFIGELQKNPLKMKEMENFMKIFMGNNNVSRYPNEKAEEKPPHPKHGK